MKRIILFTKKTKLFSILLIAIFMAIFSSELVAQNEGDYQSVSTGNWTTLATWQRFNGTSWVTPTTAQGWPGQTNGSSTYGVVTIRTGHVVTITNAGLASTNSIASLKVESTGRLYLQGSNQTVTFAINTTILNINSGGDVFFFNKSKLVLTTDAAVTLVINVSGLVADVCNNNAELWIGTQKYAVCAGAPGDIFTFSQVITAGGTLNSVPTSNSPICQGSTISLTGNYSGAVGTTTSGGSTPGVTYSWSVTAPGGTVTTTYPTQNVTIPSAVTGTYQAKLTVTTYLSGTKYTNSETIPVVVNPLPTLSGASQFRTVCPGSGATINLTGLVPNNTFEVYYNVDGGAQQTASNLTSSPTGTSSFITIPLNISDNGKNLQITGIRITNPTTNCSQSFSQNVPLSVWTTGPGTWIGQVDTDWNEPGNWCGGVPTPTTDVIIAPVSAPNILHQPIIGLSGGICRNITLNPGSSLTISGSNSLSVYGNWNNSGTFTSNTGTVNLVGSSSQEITGVTSFHNLTINNNAGVIAKNNITVNGVLNLASVSPNETNGTLEMVHTYADYSNVLTPAENLTTTKTQAHDILGSYILFMGENATTIGQGDVTGKVKRTTFAENVEYSFGNQFSTITFNKNTTGELPSELMFVITKGSDRGIHANKTNTVARLYQAIRTGGSSPTTFSLKLHYKDSELNTNTEGELVLWDHHIPYTSQNTPHEHGKTAQNTTQNWVELSGHGITYLDYQEVINGTTKYWMFGNTIIVGTKWLGAENTNWNNPSNWTGGKVPDCTDNVIIASTTHAPTLPHNNANAKTIEIEPGAILNGGNGHLTICGGIAYNGGVSSWNNQGTFNQGTSTVVFNYPRQINNETSTISGTTNFNNLTLSAGTYLVIQPDANVSVKGTFVNSGYLDAATYPNTFTYNGSDAQNIALPYTGYRNLVLSGDGAKTMPTGNLNILGDLTLNSSISFTGNTILMNGNAIQTINGTESGVFNNLTINNGAGVAITNNQTVNGTLNLTDGLITTGSNTLTVGCNGDIFFPAYPVSTSYVNGKLARIYCSTGSKDFPIGKGGNFRPLTLDYTALTDNSTVTAEQFETIIPGTLPDANTYTQNRYWNITQTGGSGFTYNLTLNGNPFNPGDGNPVILKGYETSNNNITATFSSPNFTIAGQTSFSNFAVASNCAAPTIQTQPVATSTCDGTGTPQFTVAINETYSVSYQWQVSTTGTGGTFDNITNGGVYSGATTATLSIANPPYSMNGYAYRVIINRNCGSSTTSDAATLTVNALPTITLGTNPAVCYGATSASLPYSATTGNPDQYRIDYDATAEAAGFTDVTLTTLSGSPISLTIPSTEGTFNGTLYVKNSTTTCESTGYPFTVTIYPLPQGSISGNRICSNETGMLTFTASVGTGPFELKYKIGASETEYTQTNVYSGIPFSVGTLTATTNYTLVSVQGEYCTRTSEFTGGSATVTVASPTAVTWTGEKDNEWNNPGNWSNNLVPVSCDIISIPNSVTNYPVIWTDENVGNLTVAPNAQLSIGDANTINANTFTLGSGATFLDNNGTLIANTVNVQQSLTADRNWYVSSPVSAAKSSVFNASSSKPMYWYKESLGSSTTRWVPITNGDSTMVVMKGYIANIAANEDVNFTGGTLNTGNLSMNLYRTTGQYKEGFNLVGNPYPSYLNIESIKLNSGLEPTYWYRSRNEANTAWIFDTYNITSEVSTGLSGKTVSKYIPPIQAFWVRVNSASTSATLSFDNTMRGHQDVTNNIFRAPAAAMVNKVLRLKVSNQLNADEAVVYFNENAANTYDAYDSPKMSNDNAVIPEIYTIAGKEQLVINGFKSLENISVVPLGFRTGQANNFSIEASEISNFETGTKIILRDNVQNYEQELTVGSKFDFYSDKTNSTSRFSLIFKAPNAPNAVDQTAYSQAVIWFNRDNGQITIQNQNLLNGKSSVSIYNALGQKLYQQQLTATITSVDKKFAAGVYLVTVDDGVKSVTEKVIIK